MGLNRCFVVEIGFLLSMGLFEGKGREREEA
jgi:hypothetical protein